MIVVLILAIAAALATPLLGTTRVTRLRGAADMLAADLAFAQIESITHADDPCVVVLDSTHHRYHIAKSSAPDTPIANPVGNQSYEVTFGQERAAPFNGVTVQSYSLGGDDRIQFGKYGQLDQATAATITLACEGNTLTLVIDPILGEATVASVDNDNSDDSFDSDDEGDDHDHDDDDDDDDHGDHGGHGGGHGGDHDDDHGGGHGGGHDD
jgi:Tfp pilus assembly protein FimT